MISPLSVHGVDELRRMEKRLRLVAAPLIDDEGDNTSPGLLRAAAMLARRIARFEKAECAAHRKPRRRVFVTRCERCGKNVEKDVSR